MQTIVTIYLWNTYKVSWINSDNWKCYLHLTTNTSAFSPTTCHGDKSTWMHTEHWSIIGTHRYDCQMQQQRSSRVGCLWRNFPVCNQHSKVLMFSFVAAAFLTLNFQSIWSYGPVIMLHEWRKWQKQWVQQFGKYSTIMDIRMTEKIVLHKSVWLKSLSKKCYTQDHRGNQQAEETWLKKKLKKSSQLYAYQWI